MEIHLTGNMERYMWSFDGVKLSEVTGPIIFHEGERLRVTLVNDTMMTHPIHLHGMFFDLVVGDTDHKPRKHTVIVKPAERLSFDVTADHVGDWAFHCHLLFHMHAGMMQVVSVVPRNAATGADDPHRDHTPSDTPVTDDPPPKEAPMTGMSHEGHR
jgi:FtsP/CotA-like multicopper oxidase with cupredoxin domain